MNAVEYPIPPGSVAQPCRGCGDPVYWIKTKAGQNMPLNPDGTSHFATCPKANQFRKKESVCQKHFDFDEVLW